MSHPIKRDHHNPATFTVQQIVKELDENTSGECDLMLSDSSSDFRLRLVPTPSSIRARDEMIGSFEGLGLRMWSECGIEVIFNLRECHKTDKHFRLICEALKEFRRLGIFVNFCWGAMVDEIRLGFEEYAFSYSGEWIESKLGEMVEEFEEDGFDRLHKQLELPG